MIDLIQQAIEDKRARMKTMVEVASVEKLEPFYLPKDWFPLFAGSYSWFMPRRKHKILAPDYALPLGDIITTPSEVAREYLKLKFKGWRFHATGRKETEGTQWYSMVQARSVPLLAFPGIMDDAIYIDITSAWFSIINLFGWNCDYYPLNYIALGQDCLDFSHPELKDSRSALVSICMHDKVSFYTCPLCDNGVTHYRHYPKPKEKHDSSLYNPAAYALVCDVLKSIAHVMLDSGVEAWYINNDGYIIRKRDYNTAAEIISMFGLSHKIKGEGTADIRGVGSYKIGATVSKPYRQRVRGGAFTNLGEGYSRELADWIFERAQLASHYRKSNVDPYRLKL